MTEKAADDRELVTALQRGDPDAVEQLIDRYGAWVYRVVRRLLDDPRDAEEVTQDVFLTVARKIETFRGEAAFSSWLYRIGVNAAYQRLRVRRARPVEVSLEPLLPVFDDQGRLAGPVVDWSARVQDPAVALEARAALEQGLARLPEDYRVVVLLRDVEGLTNEDVAGILGLSVLAVKSRLHRARLALRHVLTELWTVPGGEIPALAHPVPGAGR
jgi:RNA polymerase sigma-70 factor (ECF subfamily)